MSGHRPDPVSVFVRSVLPLVLFAALVAALTAEASLPLGNFDTYFHLRFGEEFLSGAWSLTHPGHVSTLEHAHWVPTQWLSEIVMAKVQQLFGLAGVAWLSGLLSLTLAASLYVGARRSTTMLAASILTAMAIFASTPGISMRPQMVSYILVAVTTILWVRAAERRTAPWVLVPLTWLWAMCHGMWPVGIAVGVVAALGIWMQQRTRRAALPFFGVPVASAVAAALTPVGPALYPAVLLVASRRGHFTEWAPPDFTQPHTIALLVLFLIAFTALARSEVRDWFDILMLGLSLVAMVYSNRTVPAAAAMLVPLSARLVQPHLTRRAPVGTLERRIVTALVLAALSVLAFVAPTRADHPPPQPAWVSSELGSLPPGTTLLANQLYGGYLMWRYPQLNLVAHGYGDVYTNAELERITDLATLAPSWDRLLCQTGAHYALLSRSWPLSYALIHDGWRVKEQNRDIDMLTAPAAWAARCPDHAVQPTPAVGALSATIR